ncbi:TonB-dependent receptor plug domain-containing protein [Paucibacter sp. JuS9]|uniref:TonB-dependent receptor plug domain-containing protein n=1 Tax=Paucibacter sp. JuS9 TaxID=3228748 RepID=UPI0037572A47
MQFRPTALALAVVGLVSQAQAQQAAPAAEPQKIERVEVTGSMIKRTDRETPSVVQVITAEDIKNSGYSNIEDLLKANSSVDLGSVGDGAASGFVSGVAAISLRGLGAQGTLTLINGRRLAPVGAVDINFGRGNLVSVNTIPKGAIERIEILKDGASAIYGSDAMAGVVNYVLKKEYQGVEIGGSVGANDQGAGKNQNVNVSFGFGNLDTQKFNIFGGLDVFHRDRVGYNELKNVGDLALYDKWNADQGVLPSFFPSSRNSFYGNYYAVPTALTTANSNVDGTSFLGTLSACPDDLTVGKGIATKSPVSTAVYPVGQCRFNTDAYAEAIAKQDRVAGSLRANFLLNSDTTAYADLMVSRTKTVQRASPYALTSSLVSSADPRAATWPLPNGSILSQSAIILPIGHPDNPTNGTSAPRAVQVLYRFDDVPQDVISDLKAARFTAGVIGVFAGWDYDAALVYSRQDNEAIRTGRILASGLNKAISAGGSAYHFGKKNDAAGIASISADASNEGQGEVTSLDVRGSRELFNMAGGKAAMAVGLEARRESLSSTPDENYQKGDYIGLVGNSTKGTRDMYGGFAELRLPVQKNLEVQAALRGEHYSDFGNSTTGKLGFKWSALPSTLAIRGTAATGYRAPSISQIGDSFVMSFHSNTAERAIDPLRCDPVTLKSKSTIPAQYRDCNLLGYTAGIPTTERTGSLATIVAANPKLKPETSQSATLGFLFSPTNSIDLSIDTWYFKRSKEIRVQGGIDVVNAYKADPAGNEQYVLRDTNQATWLRDGAGNLIANSGPILALKRQYGNFNYTITSGVDYELNIRLPANQFGKFKFKIEGTYTGRYDQKVLDTSPVSYWAGTTSSLLPKTKASARVDWSKADWNAWARFNHTDGLWSNTTSAACQTAPATSTTLGIPSQNGWCTSGGENTLDLGIGYKGFKNLRLNASMLNVTNQYTATNAGQVPAMWTFYDLNTTPMLGRRWSISATYSFE